MSMKQLLKDPLNRDIVALLTVSNLTPLEKKIWLDLIPTLSLEEREDLKKDLEAEVRYETEMSAKAVKEFTKVVEGGI